MLRTSKSCLADGALVIPGHRRCFFASCAVQVNFDFSSILSSLAPWESDVTPPHIAPLHPQPIPNIIFPLISISTTATFYRNIVPLLPFLSLPLFADFFPSSDPNTIRHHPRDRGGDQSTVDDVSFIISLRGCEPPLPLTLASPLG